FFSSRRRHTRSDRDWSSDVCSSDLPEVEIGDDLFGADFYFRALVGLLPASWVVGDLGCGTGAIVSALAPHVAKVVGVDASEEMRSEERRVGKECRGGWGGYA